MGVTAQVTLYEENFDSYSPAYHTGEGTELPDDYVSYDVDGDGLNWRLADPLGWLQDLSPIFSETFAGVGGDYVTLSLDDYIGQDIYITFRHETFDNWILGIDDISIVAGTLSVDDNTITGFNYFYSSQTQSLNISAIETFKIISIFNVLGQEIVAKNLSSNNETINMSSINKGIYVAHVTTVNGETATFK